MATEGARVHDVIESLGFGRFHVKALFLGGGVWLADGAELLLIGSITRSLSTEWGLTAIERGCIVSVLFLGVLLGNGASGALGDWYGRRVPVLLSYILIVLFSLLSACAFDVWSMTSARVLVGFSFGLGQPSWNAMLSEITPTDFRVMYSGLSMSLFIFGELYAALLIWEQDPKMHELRWRLLLVLGALPSAIFGGFAYFGLHESPTWLATKGRISDARAVLDSMRQENQSDVPIDFVPPRTEDEAAEQQDRWSQVKQCFSRHLAFPTVVTCFSTFTANFIFYGGLYAFPQVLPSLDLHLSPAANLALGAGVEIPGILIGIAMAQVLTRKLTTGLYLAGCALSVFSFLHGAGSYDGSKHEWAVLLGFIGLKVFVNVGFVVVYLYSAEIYPTRIRNTGSALCIAAGRIGSMTCPLVYELFADSKGEYNGFFYFTAGLCLVNFVGVMALQIETAGKQLDALELETTKLLQDKEA